MSIQKITFTLLIFLGVEGFSCEETLFNSPGDFLNMEKKEEVVISKFTPVGVFYNFLSELQEQGVKLPDNEYEDLLNGREELSFHDGKLCRRNPQYVSPEKKRPWWGDSDDESNSQSSTQSSDYGKTSHEVSSGLSKDFDQTSQDDTCWENIDPNSPVKVLKRVKRDITDYFPLKARK